MRVSSSSFTFFQPLLLALTLVTLAFTISSVRAQCNEDPKLLVPLYVYPGAAWDSVANGADSVETVAIINPQSGPGGPPNSDYVSYMNMLDDAGVDMVGYVHTSYGTRDINAVQADIDIYASEWPLISGIFLDEAASDAAHVGYYQTLYQYIMNLPGYQYDIINPGVVPDQGYVNVATQIVSLENSGSNVASAPVPSYASCNTKEKYAAIVHDVSASSMQSTIDAILDKNYFGYIYVTDGAAGCCTYNTLSSYYSNEASYLGSE